MEPAYILKWHQEMGIVDMTASSPVDGFALKSQILKKPANTSKPVAAVQETAQPVMAADPTKAVRPPSDVALDTRKLADACKTLDDLRDAVHSFKGLGITRTATNVVFSDGNPNSDVMFIGEAPGADEDRQGIPFCGQSGQLLSQILKYIGLSRDKNYYITNSVFWRPPGNRKPTPEELAACHPFVEKHIALINPKLIVLVGGTAVTSVLGKAGGITKIRGTFFDYTNPYVDHNIAVMPMFHPSYLLRSPGQKKYAWEDALKIAEFTSSSAR